MKNYTVIGKQNDSETLYCEWVTADNEHEAFKAAKALVTDGDSLEFIACLLGHLTATPPYDVSGKTCYANQFPGKFEDGEGVVTENAIRLDFSDNEGDTGKCLKLAEREYSGDPRVSIRLCPECVSKTPHLGDDECLVCGIVH